MPSWQLAFRSIRRRVGVVAVSAAVSVAAVAVPASAATVRSHTAPAETWVIMSRSQFGPNNQWALNDFVTVDFAQAPSWNNYTRLTWYRCSSTPNDPVNSSDCTAIAMSVGGVFLTNEESGKYIVGVGYIYDNATDTYTIERSNYSSQIGTLDKPCIASGSVCDLSLSIDDWGTNTLHWGPLESPMFSQVPVSGYQVSEFNPMNPMSETSVCTITDVSVTSCVIPFSPKSYMVQGQNVKYYVVRPVVTGMPFPMPAARIAVSTPERPGIGGMATPHGVIIGAMPSYSTVGLSQKTQFTINGKTCTYNWPLNYMGQTTEFKWGGDCASLPAVVGNFDLPTYQAGIDATFNLTPGSTYQLTGTASYSYQYGVAYDNNGGFSSMRLYVKDLPISAQVTTPTEWPASPTNVTFSKNSDGTYHLTWVYTGDPQTGVQISAKDASGVEHGGSCGSTQTNTGTQFSCDVDFYEQPSVVASWGNLTNFQLTVFADITSTTLTQAVTPTESQSKYFNPTAGGMMDNGPGWMGFSISSWGDATGAHSGSSGGGGGGGGATAPGAPTGVGGTSGNGQATVSWTAPSSTGGASITGYTVQYSSDGGNTWNTASCSGTSTSCTITGLTNGTSYTFRVAATNSAGTGSYSTASSSVTPTASVTVPGAPTNVVGTPGDGQVAVTWTAPSSNGGASITGYTVQYSTNGGSTWTTTSCTTVYTNCSITGFTNGTSYTFRVAATNSAGTGSYSTASASVTPAAPTAPGSPTLGAVTSNDTSITVNWTAPSNNGGSTITGYTVEIKDGSGNVIGTCSSTGTSCTVSPLSPGTVYTVSLVATNAQGSSTAATKSVSTTATAGKKAKRYYIRRYAKGQLGVKAKQIKQIKKAVTAIVKSGATTIRITGYTNTGAKRIKSQKRAVNVTKVVNKQLATLKATNVQVTTVAGGGTKKFGGTVLNRVVVIRGK